MGTKMNKKIKVLLSLITIGEVGARGPLYLGHGR